MFSFAGQRLLGAVGAHAEMYGAALASRRLRNCVMQACRAYPAAAPPAWAVEAANLHDTLRRAADEGDTRLSTRPPAEEVSRAYLSICSPHSANLSLAAAARVDAALGAIIVREACLARAVSSAVMSAYVTLHHAGVPRQGRHAHWAEVAANFPKTLDDVARWRQADTEPGIAAFMAALANALADPAPQPDALVRPGSDRREGDARQQPDAEGRATNARRGSTTEQSGQDNGDDGEAPKHFIGWLRGRADLAGYLSRFGVEGRWERQTKQELTAVCKGIFEALDPSHDHRHLALFATICLATSLPARRASEVKLGQNTDLWFDATSGHPRWHLPRLLKPEQADATDPNDIVASDIVDIWLPEAAVRVTDELLRIRRGASDVLELITGSTGPEAREQFLAEYRQWLRSLGYASLHGVEDARFARSMSQVLREQCGDVVAGIGGLDFEEVAIGTLHYVRVNRSFLHCQWDLAWRRVGLGPAAPMHGPDGPVGSRRALTADELQAGLLRWNSEAELAVEAMQSAASATDLLLAWNRLVHLRLIATIVLTAGRGEHLSRLTWAAVLGHVAYLLHRDNDADEYAEVRLVPIVGMLRRILDEHARDLQIFCTRAEELGIAATTPNGRRFGDRAPHRLCFYGARLIEHPSGAYLSRKAIDRPDLTRLCVEIFGRELNVGRHTLISLCVAHGVQPPLIKVLGGHIRGQAEPFSDGQWISPRDALQLLAAAMKWILDPLCPPKGAPAPAGVLALNEWTSGLPRPSVLGARPANSRERVLPEPIAPATPLALRAVDHLRQLLLAGLGPSDPSARLLANLLFIQWVSIGDIERAWSLDAPFQLIGGCTAALVMRREGCRAESHRPLVGPTALAIHSVGLGRPAKDWHSTLGQLAAWARSRLEALPWPESDIAVADSLDALLALWLRVNVSPFFLTAASSRITAPTATRASILRLANAGAGELGQGECLVFPKSGPRGSGHARVRPSPLKEAISMVHEYAAPDKTAGENWTRTGELTAELARVIVDQHLPAATYVEWITAEAALWDGSQGGRIKTSSMSTYTTNITPALSVLRPDDDMREWDEEWFDFFAFLRSTVTGKTEEERTATREVRIVAAKRFVATLASLGYAIPKALLDTPVAARNGGMRKSAAAVLLLASDRQRVTQLMSAHFAEGALERLLAPLYCELRWAFPFRSMEVGALPLDALSCFDDLVVTTDGFAHLKSRHARRFAAILQALAQQMRSTGLTVSRARAGASWMFLFDNRHDWSFVDDLEDAFSAALKQVTGERDARPHAARAVSPLEQLTPGWEPVLRRLLAGEATSEECVRFGALLRQQGFGAVTSVLLRMGQGHPVTFIKHYFALWDLMLSVLARASLAELDPDLSKLAAQHGPAVHAAYRQAKRRAHLKGTEFDELAWATSYMPGTSHLPCLVAEALDSPVVRPPVTEPAKPARASIERQALFVALRIASEDEISATVGASLSTTAAAPLEALIAAHSLGHVRSRHQADDSPKARKSEVIFLRSEAGLALARSLAQSSPATLNAFGDALTPMRAGGYARPSVGALRDIMIRFANCLPAGLGVLVQFKVGSLQAADVALLTDRERRIFVGKPDRDLGERPRLFVVPADDPYNLVARPRRTANTRSLIAALELIRSQPGG